MTDVVGEVIVVGQRRPASSGASWPTRPPPPDNPPQENGGGGGGNHPPSEPDPCADPNTAREWNADAAAAALLPELLATAQQQNNEPDFNIREYGAALFLMTDGSIQRGNITWGAETFQTPGEDGVASVTIDYTAPPGGLLIGVVHTHSAGGHLPSGNNYMTGDQAVLSGLRNSLSAERRNPDMAKLYIIASTLASSGAENRISVYNDQNRDEAISGEEGPQVNPEAQPCG